MFMVLFVFNDLGQFDDLIASWDEVGVRNVTILASTGLGKLKSIITAMTCRSFLASRICSTRRKSPAGR